MIKAKKGFTLVELVIVIVIVGILSIISVPIYRGYVEKAIMTEGKVLINAIGKAELAYHVKNDCFYSTGRVENDSVLDIDARGNKYFKEFNATSGSGSNYYGSSINASAVSKVGSDEYNDVVEIRVYGWNNGKSWTLRAVQQANGALYGFGNNREIVDSEHEVVRVE
ncbi:prepilin-type N-terminal cleavage/methylation domain-containing protein [Candidatus Ruminimicrobiellum ovillum]|uniref:prepilin-type N-terminal cleavage/methylation domain-containing protein n=1 Tax=Candidatus Ruminimicrobiellum ovillum TaxID=1947927 RepID=UPI00355A34C6